LSQTFQSIFLCLFWRVSKAVCPGWPRTGIILISASQVARITGVSHWYPTPFLASWGHLQSLVHGSLFTLHQLPLAILTFPTSVIKSPPSPHKVPVITLCQPR
jgi:hypothetical protein